jgi:hypothetical protein
MTKYFRIAFVIAFALAASAVVSGTSAFPKSAPARASQQSTSNGSERSPHGCAATCPR